MKQKGLFIVTNVIKKILHKPVFIFLAQFQDEIVSKVKAIPNFINEVLVNNLQGIAMLNSENKENSSSILNILDFHEFGNYLKLKTKDIYENLDKIAEATGK